MFLKELSRLLSDKLKIFEALSEKSKRYINIVVVGTLLLMCVVIVKRSDEGKISDDGLKRPEYGAATEFVNLDVQIEGFDETVSTTIEVMPRQYSKEQIDEIFVESANQLPRLILKENKSLEEVNSDLELVREIQGFPVTVEWYSSNYEVVNSDGTVNSLHLQKEEAVSVILTAVLRYEDYTYEHLINIKVTACDECSVEQIKKKILGDIENLEQGDTEYVRLPDEIDGKKVTFSIHSAQTSPLIILLIGCVAIFTIVAGDRKDADRKEAERKKQLSCDYSQMIAKLSLLIGAGMTVRRAWERIVLDYKRQGGDKRYVYEEMEETYNQILAGVSEATAYESFGKRCDVKEYMKFSTLLIQNMKKGSIEIVRMLELESLEAFENRKHFAKRYGEEAGTKLLLPMIIMLVIVMAIIMVPALMSFNI